jgi:general secretion pathway protein M
MSQWQAITTRWRQLSPREQGLLLLAAGVLALLLGYSLLWSPWQAARARLHAENARLRADLVWLQQLAPQVQALRAQQPTAASAKGSSAGPLPVRLDTSLRAAGLGEHLLRLEPAPDGSVNLWLNDAPFDSLIAWLGKLAAQGVVVEALNLHSGAGTGLVSARLTARE